MLDGVMIAELRLQATVTVTLELVCVLPPKIVVLILKVIVWRLFSK
jgi:hypothetical protein